MNIPPAEAAAQEAQWQADGGSWMDLGATLANLGTHQAEVSFAPIPDWVAPDSRKLWTGTGVDRVTTVTYSPVPSFSIASIPSSMAWQGKPLEFFVDSEEFAAPALITAVAGPQPAGTLSFTFDAAETVASSRPASARPSYSSRHSPGAVSLRRLSRFIPAHSLAQ